MGFYKQIDDNLIKIALWRISESEQELEALTGMDLHSKYAYPRRRIEIMVVRALLNHLNHPEPINYHPNGRPYFSVGNPHISISHTAKMVAVAFSNQRSIGVDIERVNRDFGAVAYKYLSEEELKWMDLTDQKILALAWCIKESIYKLPWSNPKNFSMDINIPRLDEIGEGGTVKVEVKDSGEQMVLVLNYLFFDEYCLSWVVDSHN